MPNKIPVLVIFAPTASGKTELLLEAFSGRPAKIISADSMQVYRGMDIGTAKPSKAEREKVPHCLIDIKNPDEQFSAAEFVERADALCEELFGEGLLPVICGGTGFYIRSFLLGLPSTPGGDEKIRAALKAELLEKGQDAMWERLNACDPDSAKKIAPRDSYRVLRALEIFLIAGKPRAAFRQKNVLRQKYEFSTIILERPRDVLYQRIEERVEKMFDAGLEQEARGLLQKYGSAAPGMQAIGYREFAQVNKDGSALSAQEAKALIKKDTKRYAKKQCVFMAEIPGAKKIPLDQNAVHTLRSALRAERLE